MNWWLAYEITLALLVLVALLWAWDARRLLAKAKRLVELHDDQPTQEIPPLPTMKMGPGRLEDLGGPARPVPPDWSGPEVHLGDLHNPYRRDRPDPWPL